MEVVRGEIRSTVIRECKDLAKAFDKARKPDHDTIIACAEQLNKLGIMFDVALGLLVEHGVIESREAFGELCAKKANSMNAAPQEKTDATDRKLCPR